MIYRVSLHENPSFSAMKWYFAYFVWLFPPGSRPSSLRLCFVIIQTIMDAPDEMEKSAIAELCHKMPKIVIYCNVYIRGRNDR